MVGKAINYLSQGLKWSIIRYIRYNIGCHGFILCRESLFVRLKMEQKLTPLIAAGIVLGIGLGGFFDGVVLHQILQWHHMLSSVRPLTTVSNMDLNMVWDGLFHAFDWVMTVAGIALLWRAGGRDDVPWSSNIFLGSLLMGAGLFNMVEGVIDHQILGIHHVKPGPHQLAWDLGFLALGALLFLVGWIMSQNKTVSLKVNQ
jgi:uncharacterized membrane protein